MEGADWNTRLTFRKEDEKSFWFKDHLHNPVPLTPMTASIHPDCVAWGYQVAAKELSVPTSRGCHLSIYRGWLYHGPKLITDEKEIKKRNAIFEQKIASILEEWDRYYSKIVDE